MYGNMDFWKYSGVCNTSEKNGIVHKKDPRYTSLEVMIKMVSVMVGNGQKKPSIKLEFNANFFALC